jgi:hypothetical protein
MSKKRNLNEDIALIKDLAEDHHNLIKSRLRALEMSDAPGEALKQALDTLKELSESCMLIRALLSQLTDTDNRQSTTLRAG